jgi:multicomponent Na+:H+ antiporter subunit A
VLQSAVVDLHLPLLGDLHLVTSVFFDIGVYLLVVGLVLDLLRSLGSAMDRQGRLGDDRLRGRGRPGTRRSRRGAPPPSAAPARPGAAGGPAGSSAAA